LPSETEAARHALPPEAPSAPLAQPEQPENIADTTHSILSRYGIEIRAFLSSRTSSRASMEEVFSVFSVDVWKGLPSFRARGHVRSWIYVVARNALARHIRFQQRWRSRHVSTEPDELHSESRRSMATLLGQQAELEPLLAALNAADRRLLEQRLMLSMAWRDIALEQLPARSEEAIERESARLRKRFQLLVRGLRERLGK
jgi:RNA polymerase sigma factor (sigma-70 family)